MGHFNVESQDGGKTLHVDVELRKFDAACAKEFRETVNANWSEDVRRVELEFSSVDFIDSSGIGALLSVQKRLAGDSEPVTIINPQPNVVSVIELLRLHRVFNLKMSA